MIHKKSKRRNRSQAEGRELAEEFRRSRSTQREFCQERGLNIVTLQYWLRKTRAIGTERQSEGRRKQQRQRFVEVKVTGDGQPMLATGRYEIRVGNGRQLKVASGFDVEEV